jgi:predicted DNA-binding protein
MKVAISLPDKLSNAVDQYAERIGATRSEIYARAVEKLLETIAAEESLKRFNDLYADDTPVDPALTAAARVTFERNEW